MLAVPMDENDIPGFARSDIFLFGTCTWEEDNSVRMFSYRQNIDAQKTQEKKLLANLERDHLSSLYNKKTTQDKIIQMLHQHPEQLFAFFILDIDAFKLVNDRFGHAVGDHVIADFAHILKNQFNEQDIVGRIGLYHLPVSLRIGRTLPNSLPVRPARSLTAAP